jgi:hypothetical protein
VKLTPRLRFEVVDSLKEEFSHEESSKTTKFVGAAIFAIYLPSHVHSTANQKRC